MEQLRRARHQWVGDMGRVLAARGYQLSRRQLQSWQAAAAAMKPAVSGPQVAAPAGPAGAQASPAPSGGGMAGAQDTAPTGQQGIGQPADGGQSAPAAAATQAAPGYAGMAAAATRREQLLRGLRGIDDTSQRCFGCLVALIVATLQVGGQMQLGMHVMRRAAAQCTCCTLQAAILLIN